MGRPKNCSNMCEYGSNMSEYGSTHGKQVTDKEIYRFLSVSSVLSVIGLAGGGPKDKIR